MNLNEKKLKLIGTANLSKELKLDTCVDLTIKNVDVESSQDNSNQDGSFDRCYKLKISELSEISIITENDVIHAKKKGSQSKVLRHVIQQRAEAEGEDPEQFYLDEMSKLIKVYKDKYDL